MQVAAVNGIHVHYRDIDPGGSRPVLVFSNSLGTDFRIWDRVIERLGDRYRIITYDKRGHGLSEGVSAPYKLSDHVEDLVGLLNYLGVSGAIVCGLSVGGLIAQSLADEHPELVDRLILCDTAHKIGAADMWNERIAAVEKGGIESLADGVLERWFSADFRANRTAELSAWRNMLVRTTADGYAGTSAAIRDADLTESSAKLGVPTLCICGSEDGATTPELVRSTADLIPGARFELIEGARHLPCIEAPDAVADLILAFSAETVDA
ncbi:MAG TPA: 3-oxoadipate enol-lactonase [Alphaproteobacteria bacterium]|nr:3-oxoadipate enol-lactonase [Alphaproteobacteria bacterium]